MTTPFDHALLDGLLEADGIDGLVATSRHNVRYLLGSYSLFHRGFDAIGADRFLPAVGLRRGAPGDAFAIGASFAPHRFVAELRALLPDLRLAEATGPLEALRTIKRPGELALLREAADGIVAAMAATVAAARAGTTKRALVERLRVEEEARGVAFDYCLCTMGTSLNRAPSDQPWRPGEVVSLDSGGERDGYIGDLCRMAVLGEPSETAQELLATVRAIQDAARAPVRPGALGRTVAEAADEVRRASPHAGDIEVVAHGMGLVAHEPPRLEPGGPPRRAETHRDRPLQEGMVLSIETTARVAGTGFVKLEDTVVVTAGGWEAYGDDARDWLVVPLG